MMEETMECWQCEKVVLMSDIVNCTACNMPICGDCCEQGEGYCFECS